MADQRLSALTQIPAFADDDLIAMVDRSNTTNQASGESVNSSLIMFRQWLGNAIVPSGGTRPPDAFPFIFADKTDFDADKQTGDFVLIDDGTEVPFSRSSTPVVPSLTIDTPADVLSVTIPANKLVAGDVLHVKSSVSIVTTSAPSLISWSFDFGATTLLSTTAITYAVPGTSTYMYNVGFEGWMYVYTTSTGHAEIALDGSSAVAPGIAGGQNTSKSKYGGSTHTADVTTTSALKLTATPNQVTDLTITGRGHVVRIFKAT